eukprot:TRINITY_DN3665_c0_g1_i2.p1 TRINITY_DN3665_c0_g1~~TRINITY_DN3665_c0_g1_i2.p1  ORF type:complete len:150 (-),score=43.81 TRINITY_DN3665_c0_g1_i2:160-585(-)
MAANRGGGARASVGAAGGTTPAAGALEYQFYQQTGLGLALSDALDGMMEDTSMSAALAQKIKAQFNRSLQEVLHTQVTTKVTFTGHLHSYRNCDMVWTWVLDHPVFKHDGDVTECNGLVKIVACDGRHLAEETPEKEKGHK